MTCRYLVFVWFSLDDIFIFQVLYVRSVLVICVKNYINVLNFEYISTSV